MRQYQIAVASRSYNSDKFLTYSFDNNLKIGSVVEVDLRGKKSFGVVVSAEPTKVKAKLKPIIRFFDNINLPGTQIQLLKWLQAYYPSGLGPIAQLFLPDKIYYKTDLKLNNEYSSSSLQLNTQQEIAFKTISSTEKNVYLLHGDTGSGKTRIYVELARVSLLKNQSVIVLTPEISLSPQLAQEFRKNFGHSVVEINSHISKKKRNQIWSYLNQSIEPKIVIGPRSALFAPLKNIGLIIVDEAHDTSYKQEQAPHYDARRVAAKLANITNSKCVFGTATPNIADYYIFKENAVPIIRLDQPADKTTKKSKYRIVSSKERNNFKRSSIFSEQFLTSMEKTTKNGLQSLIFLNRRGTARLVLCETCGWQAKCTNCDVGLVYHADLHQLSCHICGQKQLIPNQCPDCQSFNISYKSHGTKSLESEITKIFPTLKTMRFDSDNKTDDHLSVNYRRIKNGDVDIIIGTQMLSKGLHLPKLGLVGIPFADVGLSMPDYTSNERFYQILHQVLGRVGRTTKSTKTIIQSFHPDNALIQYAVNNQWSKFYQSQIKDRKKYRFPPFTYLLQLTVRKKTLVGIEKNSKKLAHQLRNDFPNLEIIGPSPRFHQKTSNNYNWQIIVKAKSRNQLLKVIKQLPSDWRHNIDPVNLL